MLELIKFIKESHEWLTVTRGREIMSLASNSFRDCFQLDSGFFIYRKRSSRLDFQEGEWSLYVPWGEFASVFPPSSAFHDEALGIEALILHLNRWMTRGEWAQVIGTDSLLGRTIFNSTLAYIGIWPLQSKGNTVGFVVIGTRHSASPLPDVAIMECCTAQVMTALDTALIRFQSQVAEAFIDHAVDAVSTIDLDGTMLQANQMYLDMFGWTTDEVIGVKIPIAAIDLKNTFFRFVRDAEKGLQFQHRRGFVKQKVGRDRPVMISLFAIRNSEGELTYVGCIIRDMSELERVNEALNKARYMYESLFQNTADAIVILSDTGRIRRVNPAFEKQTGWNAKEVVGRLYRTIPEGHKSEYDRDIEQVRHGRQVMGKRSVRIRKDGTPYPVSVTLSPILDRTNKLSGISVIKRDITKEIESEERLLKSEKLAIAGTLAASVAHEIRNPLTTVKGFLHLLKPDLTHKSREYDLMTREISQMEQIITEFLLLAKPSQTNISFVHVSDMLRDIIALMQAEANMYNVRIQLTTANHQLGLCCDATALKQVFVNLLKNSIEAYDALPHGGEIRMSIDTLDDVYLQVKIEDNGPGMTQDQVGRLGEPFYTTKEKGTGLGLMVCRRIIMNLHGELDIQSQVGVGTSIRVIIPMTNDR